MTDAQLADQAALSRTALNRIRNGRSIPRVDTAIRIARALDCRVAEIFSFD